MKNNFPPKKPKSEISQSPKVHRHLVEQVVNCLAEIFSQNRYADKLIEKTLKANKRWGARDRKFFAESVYEIVRWHRRLQVLATGKDTPPNGKNLWAVWAMWWLEQGHELPDFPEFEGLYPNSLQKFLSEVKANPAIEQSIPDWLMDHGQKELGDRWLPILRSLNQKAEVYLRANTLKTSTDELLHRLASEEVSADKVAGLDSAIKLRVRKNVFILPSFREGLFEVQDASSQKVAPLVNPQPGERIIDACAGAGGKSLHLAALMKNKGKIISMDIHEWKLNELQTRARRAGVDIIETRVIESSKTIKRLAESADAVLLDVPCSGMGVIRRNPDTKWKLSYEELQRLWALQAELLDSYSRMVKKGGRLVYATCSVFPSENEHQVENFISRQKGEWRLETSLRLDPDVLGFDGFFAAQLVRTSVS